MNKYFSNKLRRSFGLIIIISLGVLLIVGTIRRYQLKNNYSLATATILNAGIQMQKNGSWILVYTYTTKEGKKYTHEGLYHFSYDLKDSLIGKTIPCAYYNQDNGRCELLIYEHTWRQYGLTFPDSLNWTKKYFNPVIYSY
jgi:hypothetical protein